MTDFKTYKTYNNITVTVNSLEEFRISIESDDFARDLCNLLTTYLLNLRSREAICVTGIKILDVERRDSMGCFIVGVAFNIALVSTFTVADTSVNKWTDSYMMNTLNSMTAELVNEFAFDNNLAIDNIVHCGADYDKRSKQYSLANSEFLADESASAYLVDCSSECDITSLTSEEYKKQCFDMSMLSRIEIPSEIYTGVGVTFNIAKNECDSLDAFIEMFNKTFEALLKNSMFLMDMSYNCHKLTFNLLGLGFMLNNMDSPFVDAKKTIADFISDTTSRYIACIERTIKEGVLPCDLGSFKTLVNTAYIDYEY